MSFAESPSRGTGPRATFRRCVLDCPRGLQVPVRRFGAASSGRQLKGLDIPREICDTMMTSPGGPSARTVNRKELQSA